MLQVTVAIADFMWILLSSALTAGAGIATGVAGAAGGGWLLWRRYKRRQPKK